MDNYTDEELCNWLRNNSSGCYRPSAIAANRIEELSTKLKSVTDNLQSLQSLNCFDVVTNSAINTIITFIHIGEYPDVSETYNFYQPCINNSEGNVKDILKGLDNE